MHDTSSLSLRRICREPSVGATTDTAVRFFVGTEVGGSSPTSWSSRTTGRPAGVLRGDRVEDMITDVALQLAAERDGGSVIGSSHE
jgi:hypothetical protein